MPNMVEIIRQNLTNMFSGFVSYLQPLLLAIALLLIGWLLARFARAVISRVAQRVRFDDVIERAGLGAGLRQAQIRQTPSDMLGMLFYWLIFFTFLLQAVELLGLDVVAEPLRAFIGFLPQLIAGLVTLILGALLVQFIARAVQGAMAGMGVEFHQALGNIVRVLLLGVVVIIVIEQMGLDVTLLNSMFTNIVTIVFAGAALAFGIGGRSLARNVLAGYYAREQFAIGDTVEIDGDTGELIGIGTINAEIAIGADRLTVPNTRLTDGVVRVKG